jgi:flagellar biogenesis protein FliO
VTAGYLFAIAVTGCVMGITFGALQIAKRRGVSMGRIHPIRLLAQRTIGPAANLVLVEVEGRKLLIGVTRGAISLIDAVAERPTADVLSFDTPFSAIFKRANGR